MIAFVPELEGAVQLTVTAPFTNDAAMFDGALGATPLTGERYSKRFGDPIAS